MRTWSVEYVFKQESLVVHPQSEFSRSQVTMILDDEMVGGVNLKFGRTVLRLSGG